MSLTVADRLDIGQLSQRYAWALDHGDYEGFADCFVASDGCVEIRSGQGDSSGVEKHQGRVRLMEFARKHYETTKLQLKHIICSELFEEVSPGLAHYKAQFICFRPGRRD
ncbi:hypothetical protein EHS25_000022 [Saitozyma podzolica]|uniref:SnoaL-like domain-containing protein n=1 Tax=Saitozyma podzolica TaxID=1890683 RepID=A0A427YUX7_9TREE|nr:hypothetical protein EHS25_000022 [Saitozyma podzolica]